MDGWVDGQMNYKDQAGALWGTLEKESRPHKGGCTCWEYMLVNKFTRNTERHPEKQFVYVCECTCMCEWFVISALGAKRKKTPLNKSCPQHQLPEEILSWGFWFPSSGYGSCVGKLKSVHPI